MSAESRTLVLTQGYEPIKVINWKRAVTLLSLGKCEVIEEYDHDIRSTSIVFKCPAVVRLLSAFKRHKKPVKFSRVNIFARDKYKCFAAGTRILMADGRQVNIENIAPGDRVVDAFGRPTSVVTCGSRIRPAVEISHRGSYEKTVTTADHPFLTPSRKFVPVGDRPEYLVFPRTIAYELAPPSRIDVSAALPDRWFRLRDGRIYCSRRPHEHGFPTTLDATPDLAYILGLYVADGSATDAGRVTWAFNTETKLPRVAEVEQLIAALGLVPGGAPSNRGKGYAIGTSNKVFAYLLRSLCDAGAPNKRIPWSAIGPYHAEFLRGLFLGDGCVDRDRRKVSLNMTSYNVIFGAQSMLWGLGVYPTVQSGTRPDRLPTWTLVLQGANYSQFMQHVLGEKAAPGDTIYGDGEFVFRKMQSIEPVEGDVEVFNFETESHSYIANGLAVHNCQYCGQKGRLDDLTYDHVTPKSQGGKTVWKNIVTACYDCNAKKRDRTPEQAKMRLRTKPIQPRWVPAMTLRINQDHAPSAWATYLYWTQELTG